MSWRLQVQTPDASPIRTRDTAFFFPLPGESAPVGCLYFLTCPSWFAPASVPPRRAGRGASRRAEMVVEPGTSALGGAPRDCTAGRGEGRWAKSARSPGKHSPGPGDRSGAGAKGPDFGPGPRPTAEPEPEPSSRSPLCSALCSHSPSPRRDPVSAAPPALIRFRLAPSPPSPPFLTWVLFLFRWRQCPRPVRLGPANCSDLGR